MRSAFRLTVLALVVLAAAPVARADKAEREANARLRAAHKAFEDGDFPAAVTELDKSIAAKPSAKAYLLLGNAKLKLGQLDEARAAFQKVIELDPKSSHRATVEGYVRDLETLAHTRLQVSSDPPGATVYIDMKSEGAKGNTPVAVGVTPGGHRVMLELDGYDPLVVPRVVAVERKDVPVDAKLVPKGCDLALTVAPAGAQLSIDGGARGPWPPRQRLRAGAHTLAFSAEGHVPVERALACEIGKSATLSVTLPELPKTTVTLRAPDGVTVALDGTPAAASSSLEVAPGAHVLEVRAPAATPVAAPIATPVYKKWWFWTTLGIVAAGAAVGIGLGIGLGMNSGSGSPGAQFTQRVF
jgi:PEGA domain/Tetratricopeptide repeat